MNQLESCVYFDIKGGHLGQYINGFWLNDPGSITTRAVTFIIDIEVCTIVV